MKEIVLFGVRSPLLPDYEETCGRLELKVAAAVRVDSLSPRILDRSKVVELADLGPGHRDLPFLACAFNPKRREELAIQARDAGLAPAEPIFDPSAVLASSTRVGIGTFVGPGVVVAAAGFFGEHVFINRATNLGHHVVLADFVSVGPGVTISGNVRIGTQSVIGSGCVILPGVRIGDGVLAAAGSVIRRNVPDGALCSGSPAKTMRYRPRAGFLSLEGQE